MLCFYLLLTGCKSNDLKPFTADLLSSHMLHSYFLEDSIDMFVFDKPDTIIILSSTLEELKYIDADRKSPKGITHNALLKHDKENQDLAVVQTQALFSFYQKKVYLDVSKQYRRSRSLMNWQVKLIPFYSNNNIGVQGLFIIKGNEGDIDFFYYKKQSNGEWIYDVNLNMEYNGHLDLIKKG